MKNAKRFSAVLLPGIRMLDGGGVPEEMRLRVEKARDVYFKTGAPLIVACGADAAGVGISEAEMMKKLLCGMGVAEKSVVTEDRSFITAENLQNALSLVEKGSLCALVTSDYHMRRARLLARRTGFRVKGFKAKTPFGAAKMGRRVMEFLGYVDALMGWQDEKTRPKSVERFKRFLSQRLIKPVGEKKERKERK